MTVDAMTSATTDRDGLARPEAQYLKFLAEGRFMIQRSRASGRHIFYPRVMEPGTGCTDLEWVPASGCGTIYSITIVRKKPPEAPYNVVLVDLAEGPRMMSRVDGVPLEQLRIGMAVQARVVQEQGRGIVVFEPAAGETGARA